MQNTIYRFFAAFFLPTLLIGQHVSTDQPLLFAQAASNGGIIEQEINLSGYPLQDFIAVSLALDGPGLSAATVQAWLDEGTGWEPLPPFSEEVLESRFVSELFFASQPFLRVKIVFAPELDLSKVRGRAHLFAPSGAASGIVQEPETGSDFVCPCPQPPVVPRSSWGLAWNLNGSIYAPPAVYTAVTHLIVHHSAGTNTSSNWPGVVAAIFDFHVNTNGWADVGYNWLIDPNGVLYEGRGGGNNVRGAHMCGYNDNTMGVCLLGNFVATPPPTSALETLKKLLAWKCCNSNIDPTGSSAITSYPGVMKHISGHRDGCSPNYTECPGGLLYAEINALRTAVAQHIQTVCSLSPTQTLPKAKPSEPTLSPNPSTGWAYIQWPEIVGDGTVRVHDARGRMVTAIECPAGTTDWPIHLQHLVPGIYWAEIRLAEGPVFRKKILVAFN